MRYYYPQRNIVWTVLFSILLVVTLTACGDSNNVTGPPPPVPLSPDAKLSSLTVNTGPLDPVFSGDIANYAVNVATSVGSVTVTARPQNANASMTINGQTTASGQARTITLGVAGSNTPIPIVVTAVSGSQNTYIVTVNRAAPGGDNNLSALSVTGQTLTPAFSASQLNYTVNVATTVASVAVTARKSDPNAVMSGSVTAGGGQATGQATIPLGGAPSSTIVSIIVTAPNGNRNTYIVTVNRAAPGGNNNLSALSVTGQTLSPAFAVGTLDYTVNVASGVGSVTVTATLQDTNASMTVNGQGTSSGTARSISLQPAGSNTTITIVVIAPNGIQKIYLVTVIRTAFGGNNNLSALSVTGQTLSPAFAVGTLDYTVNVASGVGSVTVTATLQDTNASMTVNGQGTSSGTARSISLQPAGSNTTITIVVIAPNGIQKIYLVTVIRTALASDAGLSNLQVSTGTLSPLFVAPGISGLPGYTVAVPNATTSITVTAVKADPNATLTISPSATVNNLPVGNTVFTIEVTAPNLNQKTYFVTVIRLAPLSNNADLSALEVFAGAAATPPALALTPSPFSSATTSYTTAEVDNTVTQVTIVATRADPNATMTIGGVASTGQTTVNIGAPGSTTQILIVVTPPSGPADAKTYTVDVPKAL